MKIILLLIFLTIEILANIGTIMALRGDATIFRNSKTIKAKSGLSLFQKDTIVTQNRTRMQIILTDDTIITIGKNSSFELNSYLFSGKKSKLKMRANRGFFRAVTGKIGRFAPKRFQIKTKTATIGIRGTDFSALLEPKREVFKCYSGKIRIFYDNLFKDVNAGEFFEIKIKNLKLRPQLVRKIKQRVSQVRDITTTTGIIPINKISDLTEIQRSSIFQKDKITPLGVPCDTN